MVASSSIAPLQLLFPLSLMLSSLCFCFLLSSPLVAGFDLPRTLESRATVNASSLPGSLVSTAWYAGWHATSLPLSAVSWSKYTEMNYAFALTTPDPNVISLEDSDRVILQQFVSAAHKHNVKASLSIGGWTGSRWFSPNVASAANRTAFVKSVTGLVKQHKLDGIDFDWEYPGIQGIGCNVVNPNDTTNFLSFLQELRQTLGPGIVLSAATDVKPFAGPSGTTFEDISKFGEVLDYIVIMNYDIKSTPSTGAGPNSPLDDSCQSFNRQYGSAQSAVTAWTKAGMPKDRIVLGAPMYGHSYRVPKNAAFSDNSNTTLASFPPYDINNRPTGDQSNGEGGLDVCGVYQAPGGTYAFRSLVDHGFLNADGSAAQEMFYRYDACSETPYVYDPKSEIMVTYDNPESFAAKGDFVKSNGLRGFGVWEAAGDFNDLLLNAILNGTINGAPRTAKAASQPLASAASSSSGSPTFSALAKLWLLVFGLSYFCGWISI
ncbi:putative glycosyl hydrolase 18 family protein [Lyophyllum shimeji]|uniref:Glycosyl hydrolase 18 family protein n=1 Tax=Lyophyllum shimeji TaxID=47721 RepID=A0A9P3PL13_LYOSH|nr:putative glycosyl hydrolase 18 family protein [Lyophyllum shimeji]